MTAKVFAKINLTIRNTKYISFKDTNLINGTDVKSGNNNYPTLRFPHAEVRNEGYWNTSHTTIQLEIPTGYL